MVFGLRGGYRFSGSAGFEGSLSYFNADTFGLGIDPVEVDAGGPFNATADSFSAHVGVALELGLSQSLYLRPDARARWLEDSEDVDLEATLVGFRF